MNPVQSHGIAQAVIQDRIREANNRRPARESRRRDRSGARTKIREPRRHSPLWSVVHLGRAYN